MKLAGWSFLSIHLYFSRKSESVYLPQHPAQLSARLKTVFWDYEAMQQSILVKMLTGIIAPTGGEIQVMGFYPNKLEKAFKH